MKMKTASTKTKMTARSGFKSSGWGGMPPLLHAQHVRCVRNLLNLGSAVMAARYVISNVSGTERASLLLALQSVTDITDLQRALEVQEA